MRIAGMPLQQATEFVAAVEALENMANGIIALHNNGCDASCVKFEITAEGDAPFAEDEGPEYEDAEYGCLWILRKPERQGVDYEVVFYPDHVRIVDRTQCIDGTAEKPEETNVSYAQGLAWVIELYSKMFWAQVKN